MGQICGKTQIITSTDLKGFDAEGKEHSNQPSNKSSSQHSHPEPGMFLILILCVVCL